MSDPAKGGGSRYPETPVARFVEVADQMSLGLALIDDDGHYFWLSRAARALLGSSGPDLLGTVADTAIFSTAEAETVIEISEPVSGQRRSIAASPFNVSIGGSVIHGVQFHGVDSTFHSKIRLDALMRATSVLAFNSDLRSALDALAHEVRGSTGLATCTIFVTAEPPKLYEALGKAGFPSDLHERIDAAVLRGVHPYTLQAGLEQKPVVFHNFRTRLLADPRWEPVWDYISQIEWNTYVAFPLLVRGKSIGAISGFLATDSDPSRADITFISAMADQAAIAIDSSRLLAKARLLALERERYRIAEDLHDSVAQTLYSLSLRLSTAESLASGLVGSSILQTEIAASRALVGQASKQVRTLLAQNSRPGPVSEGLVTAIRRRTDEIALDSGILIDVVSEADLDSLPERISESLYRIVIEAVSNARRHAAATYIRVSLQSSGSEAGLLDIEIVDNGTGFSEYATSPSHLGIANMQERAGQLGATLTISPRRFGSGTVVRILAAPK